MSGVAPSTPPELLGNRGSLLLRGLRLGNSGAFSRGTLVALLSTVLVFGVIALIAVNSPGWTVVQRSFFSADVFNASLPGIVKALWKNIQLFLVAEAFILVLAL